MTKKTYEDPTLFDGADYVTQELLWEDWNNEVTVGAIKESLKNLKDEYFIHQYNDWVEDGCERQFLRASFYVVRPATEEEISECKRELEKMLKAQPVKESVTDLVNKLNKALKEEGIKGSVTICGKELSVLVPESAVKEPANPVENKKLEQPLSIEENKSLLPKEEKIPLEQKYDYMRRLGGAFDMGNVYQEQFNKILKEREEREKGLKKC